MYTSNISQFTLVHYFTVCKLNYVNIPLLLCTYISLCVCGMHVCTYHCMHLCKCLQVCMHVDTGRGGCVHGCT